MQNNWFHVLEIILFDRNNLLHRNHFIFSVKSWPVEGEEDLDSFSLAGLFTSPARTCDCRSCDSQEEQKAENLDKRERDWQKLEPGVADRLRVPSVIL